MHEDGALPLPEPGEAVLLDASASADYARSPFHLLLTEPAVASGLDVAEGRSAEAARWVLLKGWELDGDSRPLVMREALPARREALNSVAVSAAVAGRHRAG